MPNLRVERTIGPTLPKQGEEREGKSKGGTVKERKVCYLKERKNRGRKTNDILSIIS